MHNFILWIFNSLKNIEKFLRLICVFLIMMIAFYWIMNLIGTNWGWMGIISPVLDGILDFANSVYSFSFDFWGKTLEIKYFNATIIILLVIFALKLINIVVDMLQEAYENFYAQCKKTNERLFNQELEKSVKKDEKRTSKYMIFIQTRALKRYSGRASQPDIYELNNTMNKFLSARFNAIPTETCDGFLYYLDNFDKVDYAIDALREQIHSPAPLEYFVCIQIGNETDKIKTLIGLQEWNKIILSADTLNRYRYNSINRYEVSNVGIFQKGTSTMEVYEIPD